MDTTIYSKQYFHDIRVGKILLMKPCNQVQLWYIVYEVQIQDCARFWRYCSGTAPQEERYP